MHRGFGFLVLSVLLVPTFKLEQGTPQKYVHPGAIVDAYTRKGIVADAYAYGSQSPTSSSGCPSYANLLDGQRSSSGTGNFTFHIDSQFSVYLAVYCQQGYAPRTETINDNSTDRTRVQPDPITLYPTSADVAVSERARVAISSDLAALSENLVYYQGSSPVAFAGAIQSADFSKEDRGIVVDALQMQPLNVSQRPQQWTRPKVEDSQIAFAAMVADLNHVRADLRYYEQADREGYVGALKLFPAQQRNVIEEIRTRPKPFGPPSPTWTNEPQTEKEPRSEPLSGEGPATPVRPESPAADKDGSNPQDRAHRLASQAGQQKAVQCPRPNNLSLEKCHSQFPDGCSASAPQYDAYLNFLKGQDPDASLAPTRVLTPDDFKNFESQLPRGTKAKGKVKAKKGLTSSNHATFANQFANFGEGNIYSVIAYLYFVEDTGKGTSCRPGVAETTNCKITEPDSADYHIGLGFNTTLAQSARTHPQPCTAAFGALEKDSFVAEMTPFPRHSRHPNWSIASVSAHLGKQVKVVGQLMVDNDHFIAHDDCRFTPQMPTCWRSTVWEIHPVTKFYVCNVSSGCNASSPDSAWTDLD